jgi:hypothetical protein
MIDISFRDCWDDPGSHSGIEAFEGGDQAPAKEEIAPTASISSIQTMPRS